MNPDPSELQQAFTPSRRSIMKSAAAVGMLTASGMALPRSARAAPVKGGTMTLGLAGANTTDSLDPGLAWDDFMMALTVGALRNNLVELDPNGHLIGELAESWTSSADAKTWIFKLRKNVEFHNGRTLKAIDVIASINHHRGASTTSLVASAVSQIVSVTADDPSTIRIGLQAGNADLPYILADYHMGIMPANPDGTADWQSGIGTGGYKLDNFQPGVQASASRFANYWKPDRAFADKVVILAINDVTSRQNALVTGAIDIMDRVDLKTLSLLRRSGNIRIVEVEGYQHATLPMLVNVKPFTDNNVRLALKYAVDRQEWVDTVLHGHGYVGNDHPIPRDQIYFDKSLPQRSYDADKAKYYLKQSGLTRLSVNLSAADAAFPGAVDSAVLFQASAAAAGIDINVVREPNDGYWDNVWAKKPFCACYWSGRPTPDQVFSEIYAKNASFGDTNWDDAKFNQLLLEARPIFDRAKRAEIYSEMQALMRDSDGTVVPMFMNYVMGVNSRIGTPDKIAVDLPLDGMKAIERWWVV